MYLPLEMRPPSPAGAAALFLGLTARQSRVERLVSELDGFCSRGSMRLIWAAAERDRVPELDQFLTMVDAGIEALIREALADERSSQPLVDVLMALCSISVWQRLARAPLTDPQRQGILADLLMSAIDAVRSRAPSE